MVKWIINLSLISLFSCVVTLNDGLQDKLDEQRCESVHVDLIMEVANEDFEAVLYKFAPDTNKYHSGIYIGINEVQISSEVPCLGYTEGDSSISENPFSPSTDVRFQLHSSQSVKFIYSNILQETINDMDTLVSTKLDSGKYYFRFKQIYGDSGIYKFEVQSEADTCHWKMALLK